MEQQTGSRRLGISAHFCVIPGFLQSQCHYLEVDQSSSTMQGILRPRIARIFIYFHISYIPCIEIRDTLF